MDLFANEYLDEWYAPQFRGNRDRPEEERAEVKLRPLSTAELKRAEALGLAKAHKGAHPYAIASTQTWHVVLSTLKTHIVEVRNFFVVEHGERKAITSGVELVEFCSSDRGEAVSVELLSDIYLALRDRTELEEGLRKNLNSRSASQSAETAP